MKRRIINIVELFLHFITLAALFFSKYKSEKIVDYYNGLPVYSSTEKVERFWISYFTDYQGELIVLIPLIILWATSIIMCIVSICSKQKDVDGIMHAVLPVIIFIITTLYMGLFSLMYGVYNFNAVINVIILMLLIIIIGFVKRSRLFVQKDQIHQQAINNMQTSTNADELKKYKDLLDSGVITQEEFDAKKKQLLGL